MSHFHEHCPHCGAKRTSSEQRCDITTNNEFVETSVYACGLMLRYSPTLQKVLTLLACANRPESQQERQHRAELVESLQKLIADAQVSEDFKNTLRQPLQFFHLHPLPVNQVEELA